MAGQVEVVTAQVGRVDADQPLSVSDASAHGPLPLVPGLQYQLTTSRIQVVGNRIQPGSVTGFRPLRDLPPGYVLKHRGAAKFGCPVGNG